MAAYARLRLIEGVTVYLDEPTEWTKNAFAYRHAGDERTAASVVYVQEQQARALVLQVQGGERIAGSYATTDRGPILPGRDVTLDEHGNMSRDAVGDAIAKGTRYAPIREGMPPASTLPGPDKVQVIAVIAEKVDYKVRFPFHDIVRDAILKKASEAMDKHLGRRRATQADYGQTSISLAAQRTTEGQEIASQLFGCAPLPDLLSQTWEWLLLACKRPLHALVGPEGSRSIGRKRRARRPGGAGRTRAVSCHAAVRSAQVTNGLRPIKGGTEWA